MNNVWPVWKLDLNSLIEIEIDIFNNLENKLIDIAADFGRNCITIQFLSYEVILHISLFNFNFTNYLLV